MSLSQRLEAYIGEKAAGVLGLLAPIRWQIQPMDNPDCNGRPLGTSSINSQGVVEVCVNNAARPIGATAQFGDYSACADSTAVNAQERLGKSITAALGSGPWECTVTGALMVSSPDSNIQGRLTGACGNEWVTVAARIAGVSRDTTAVNLSHNHTVTGTTGSRQINNHDHRYESNGGPTAAVTDTAAAAHTHPVRVNQVGQNVTRKEQTSVEGSHDHNGQVPTAGSHNHDYSLLRHTHPAPIATSQNANAVHRHGLPAIGMASNTEHDHAAGDLATENALGSHQHQITLAIPAAGGATLTKTCQNLSGNAQFRVEFRATGGQGTVDCHSASIAAVCRRV